LVMRSARTSNGNHNGQGTELDPIELQLDTGIMPMSVESLPGSMRAQADSEHHMNFTAPNAFQGALEGFDFGFDTSAGDAFNWFPNTWGTEFQGQNAQQEWA
jgi:hypothetical protein